MFHLSTRKSGHPTLCPKSWVGSPTNQARAWIVPLLQVLLTTLQDQAGHGAPDIDPTAVPKVSLLPAASNQARWAQRQVITLFSPTPSKMARCQAANLNSPAMRKMLLVKTKMPNQTRVGSRLQAMARWHQMAKKGRNALILKTPSPTLARSLVHMRTQTRSLTLKRKSSLSSESGAQKAPRRTAPLRSPANCLLSKCHQWTRHSVMRPGKKLSYWTHVSMPGIAKRLLKASWAGPPGTP